MRPIAIVFLALLAWSLNDVHAKEDALAEITRIFRTSPCVVIEFQEVVDSDVFETIDTVDCELVFDSTGRFRLEIGEDIYLRTATELHSYVPDNNQVIIEEVAMGSSMVSVLWIRHLDEYFDSVILDANKHYKLTVRPSVSADVPDSLTVFVSASRNLERIEFLDENGDIVVLNIRKQVFSGDCGAKAFEPDFPDSVERVRL